MSEEFLPFALPDVTEEEVAAVAETVRSGWLTTGPSAAAFEEEFAAFVAGADTDKIAVAVNSATAGLHLALEALGVKPGDEVLVPDWTFTATAEVVRYLGATPVLVDVDPATLNIDLEAAERRISERSTVIMPVHFAGLAVDHVKLRDFAQRHSLRVVEDAAHALPSASDGARVGSGTSDAVVYSFYATKTITTGEGGMVVVSDPQLAERIRVMRLHGINRDVFDRYTSASASWRYEVVAPGFKYNMSDMAAAMGRVQLRRAQSMRDRRAEIAARYSRAFADLAVQLPAEGGATDEHAWHLYVLRLTPAAPCDRDSFIGSMRELGVGTSVHFIPLHLHPVWQEVCRQKADDLPIAHREFDRAVSLPIFSSMTDEQVDRVIRSVTQVLG